MAWSPTHCSSGKCFRGRGVLKGMGWEGAGSLLPMSLSAQPVATEPWARSRPATWALWGMRLNLAAAQGAGTPVCYPMLALAERGLGSWGFQATAWVVSSRTDQRIRDRYGGVCVPGGREGRGRGVCKPERSGCPPPNPSRGGRAFPLIASLRPRPPALKVPSWTSPQPAKLGPPWLPPPTLVSA